MKTVKLIPGEKIKIIDGQTNTTFISIVESLIVQEEKERFSYTPTIKTLDIRFIVEKVQVRG